MPSWFSITEMPESITGNGTVILLIGFNPTVFKPVTYNVVIWPGATRMIVGSAYPVPASVGPWPKAVPMLSTKGHKEIRREFSIEVRDDVGMD